jgi:DNA polymerase-3 subunit alpha (Gram-positive type)
MKYYILDVETSGLNAKINEITEFSIVRCSDLVQKTWYLKIRNPKVCQPQALAITGKTIKELLSRENHLEDVIDDINAFIEEDGGKPNERVIIAHNYSFDQRFCEQNWEKYNKTFPANMWECTMAMSKKYIKQIFPDEKRPKATLDHLLKRFNIKQKETLHSAATDCRATYRLRDFLLKQGMKEIQFIKKSKNVIEKEKLIITSSDIEDPCMDEIFKFT